METYTLYYHQPGYERLLEKVKAFFPNGKILESTEEGGVQQIMVHHATSVFTKRKTLELNYRQRQRPGYQLQRAECPVTAQLMGMYNFVAALPADNTAAQQRLLRKIETINVELNILLRPGLTEDFRPFLEDLARDYDALLFVQDGTTLNKEGTQQFQDSQFRQVLDVQGHAGNGELEIHIDSKYFDEQQAPTEAQLARKAATEALLEERGVRVNTHLPCVPDAGTVQTRTAQEVIDRAYALTIMAALGEGVDKAQLDGARKEFNVHGFSPQETAFYAKAELTDRDKALCTWRYESLNVLLWALGFVDSLVYPSTICDVAALVNTMIKQPRSMVEFKARLRSNAEILNALDQAYRMHWACVQARLDQQEVGGALNASVVYERHYALNWLVRYQEQGWDDVTTDT